MTRRYTCNYLRFNSTVSSYSTSRHRPNKPLFTRMSLSELAAINTVLVSMHAASAAQREALTMQMTLRSLESPRRPCSVPAATRSTENTVAALADSTFPLPAPTSVPRRCVNQGHGLLISLLHTRSNTFIWRDTFFNLTFLL